ncbi:transformer-2 protein homolog alpha-like isoform X2 [Dermacentor andersoni]|uniref:transformer-2 protein homolog alpha-like isoform X2 n=1 Tax=Dermacentor andersoni TaxID=34620 RepID=UPI00241794EC|nr:transformer-2 protein homolog alpha-like isoform X2 [Dermacentor andersoni]
MSDREGTPEEEAVEEYLQDNAGGEEEEEEPAAEREEDDDDGGRKSHDEGTPEEDSRSDRRRQRSRTRSRSRSRRRHRHYSRSRSRSPRRSRYYYSRSRRSHSRSPMSNRRRHVGSRDNPSTSRCLGVFGLSLYTQERDLKEVFSKYGPLEDVQVVYDAQSGRSRGFAFVYFETVEDAKAAKDRCNGLEIDGRKIRVDYSITQRAHTPTPGIYMGKPSYGGGGGGSGGGGGYGGGGGGYRGGYRDRSPSPYYSRGRRYSRSRSRSYSPRRYGYY